jgi:hypothetical protein
VREQQGGKRGEGAWGWQAEGEVLGRTEPEKQSEYFDPGEDEAEKRGWGCREASLEVGNLATMVEEADRPDFGNVPLNDESLLNQLTVVLGLRGVETNLPTSGVVFLVSWAEASDSELAPIAERLLSCRRNQLPQTSSQRPPLLLRRQRQLPPKPLLLRMRLWQALLRCLPSEKPSEHSVFEVESRPVKLQGQEDVDIGVSISADRTTPEEETMRVNPGAQRARRRDPWATASIVLSIPRVEKAAKNPVPLSQNKLQSKILTGLDYEAAIEEKRKEKVVEEAKKEQKRAERDRMAAKNAERAAKKKEEIERARQAMMKKARATAGKREKVQREKAVKRKYDEPWDANTKVLPGPLSEGAAVSAFLYTV